jgi:hypothetical protein
VSPPPPAWYDVSMRRVLAILLLAVFSLPLVAPAFASAPDESTLPACCRRNGEHHCVMPGMVTANVPPRYRSVSAKCPVAPFAGIALMLPHVFAAHTAPASVIPAASPAALVREAEAGYRISFERARQKRGPPALLGL